MIDDDPAPAIAYLRSDLCDHGREWDERRIEKQAQRLGYELCATIRTDSSEIARLSMLLGEIRHHRAEAVFVPAVDHLDGQLNRIMRVADVIDLRGGCYARWNPLTEIMGVDALVEHRDVNEGP